MWCYRRILKISWMDMLINEEVLDRMFEKTFYEIEIENRIKKKIN